MAGNETAVSQPAPVAEAPRKTFFQRWGWVLLGLLAAGAVVLLLAPAASEDPDGLDRVSEDEGFSDEAKDSQYEWLPDYTIPGVDNEWVSVVLAGLIGVIVVFFLTIGVGEALEWRRRRAET